MWSSASDDIPMQSQNAITFVERRGWGFGLGRCEAGLGVGVGCRVGSGAGFRVGHRGGRTYRGLAGGCASAGRRRAWERGCASARACRAGPTA